MNNFCSCFLFISLDKEYDIYHLCLYFMKIVLSESLTSQLLKVFIYDFLGSNNIIYDKLSKYILDKIVWKVLLKAMITKFVKLMGV